MKKIVLFFALIVGCSMYSMAQKMQEVVYLKNGSIIKGVVIEQIPGQSLKIRTTDGNTFAYPMAEVEKITKEETKDFQSQSRKTKGYRNFTTLGVTIGTGDYGDEAIEVLTSHGYQFNPYFYLGGGLGVSYHTDWETTFIPIFANARVNFLNANIVPFFDFKIGYSPFDGTGLYISPSVGTSFSIGTRSAISCSLGYTFQNADIDYYVSGYYGYGYHIPGFTFTETQNIGGVTLRVGIEF